MYVGAPAYSESLPFSAVGSCDFSEPLHLVKESRRTRGRNQVVGISHLQVFKPSLTSVLHVRVTELFRNQYVSSVPVRAFFVLCMSSCFLSSGQLHRRCKPLDG